MLRQNLCASLSLTRDTFNITVEKAYSKICGLYSCPGDGFRACASLTMLACKPFLEQNGERNLHQSGRILLC